MNLAAAARAVIETAKDADIAACADLAYRVELGAEGEWVGADAEKIQLWKDAMEVLTRAWFAADAAKNWINPCWYNTPPLIAKWWGFVFAIVFRL